MSLKKPESKPIETLDDKPIPERLKGKNPELIKTAMRSREIMENLKPGWHLPFARKQLESSIETWPEEEKLKSRQHWARRIRAEIAANPDIGVFDEMFPDLKDLK